MRHITISVELTNAEAWDLAQFIKRVPFDQCFELTESWQSHAQRDQQTHRMLYALDQVAGALKVAGHAPR